MNPPHDDPQLQALEARLAAAAKEIEAVTAEAEKLWPDPARRWTAYFVGQKPEASQLYHERIPEPEVDEDI